MKIKSSNLKNSMHLNLQPTPVNWFKRLQTSSSSFKNFPEPFSNPQKGKIFVKSIPSVEYFRGSFQSIGAGGHKKEVTLQNKRLKSKEKVPITLPEVPGPRPSAPL